jgi:hypothetical protein
MDLKDTYTKVFLQAAGEPLNDDIIKQCRNAWWWNVRAKDSGGLRMTESALEFINDVAQIKTYKVDFPKDFGITAQVLLWLDNYIDSPYYITKKHITVLKERAAFELYLFSGDIKKFGHNKALSRRLSQESTPDQQ